MTSLDSPCPALHGDWVLYGAEIAGKASNIGRKVGLSRFRLLFTQSQKVRFPILIKFDKQDMSSYRIQNFKFLIKSGLFALPGELIDSIQIMTI